MIHLCFALCFALDQSLSVAYCTRVTDASIRLFAAPPRPDPVAALLRQQQQQSEDHDEHGTGSGETKEQPAAKETAVAAASADLQAPGVFAGLRQLDVRHCPEVTFASLSEIEKAWPECQIWKVCHAF